MNQPFQIPLYSQSINQDSFNIIKDEVKEYINLNPTKFIETWDCPTKSTINLPKHKNIKSELLEKEIKIHNELYFKHWGFKTSNLNLSSLWINISPPNAYQEPHKHTTYHRKQLFSGVLYIEVQDNSGDLILVNPVEDLLGLMPFSNSIIPRHKIKPQNGLIVCFPSWMEHYTNQNKTNTNRISISWNIEVINNI